jgi:pimeloyl-ACP methyl ester carboxylesterase
VRTTATAHTEAVQASTLTGEPQWLAIEPEPIYAVLHTPPANARTGLGALILPAFGWDDECSYRRRRDWAIRLARAGITTARFDFPGCENSAGSPLAEGRGESWTAATIEAVRWLRERSGCERLTAVGIGLGALIACQAASAGAAIDDFVLWGVRSSGRAYVRELRAYAAMTAPEQRDGSEAPGAERAGGAIGVGGHVMSAETAATLSRIDVTTLTLPDADRRRALLIGRDSHGVDLALARRLREREFDVSTLESDEYKGLMSPPDLELTPTRAIAASVEWMLAAQAAPSDQVSHPPQEPAATTLEAVCLDQEGVRIRERILKVDTPAGRLIGVLSEPTGGRRAPYCLVTVNSGALRHTGPNRLFVKIARRAAAGGVPAARFDLPGLGDSAGTTVKSFERSAADEPDSLAAINAIYDHLERAGVAERFVAGGFSLGGYLMVRMALAESGRAAAARRLLGAISVNPTGFSWTVKQRKRAARDFTAMAGPEALTASAARHPVHVPTGRLAQLRRRLEAKVRMRLAHSDRLWSIEHRREIAELRRGIDRLRRSGTRLLLLLSEDEPLLRMLEQPRFRARLAAAPNVEVTQLPDNDHLLRPLWIQERVAEQVADALIGFDSGSERPVIQGESSRPSKEV